MIKLENVVLASPEQMEFIIEGMRNPMNSWEKSDSNRGYYVRREIGEPCSCYKIEDPTEEDLRDEDVEYVDDNFELGENDHSLMQRLSNAGTEHRKYMRMMPIYVRITAPLYWWKEFDTYKVGTVANSCSTMHKIAEKEFTMEDFSCEHLTMNESPELELFTASHCAPVIDGRVQWTPLTCMFSTIAMLNKYRKQYIETKDKNDWWQLIQLLPSSYNQTRNVMLNYEVLANIYRQRKNHKLDEWREFCKWIEELPYSELIIGNDEKKSEYNPSDWMNMAIDILLKDAKNRPTLCDCSDIQAWLEEERGVLNGAFKIQSPSDYAKTHVEWAEKY